MSITAWSLDTCDCILDQDDRDPQWLRYTRVRHRAVEVIPTPQGPRAEGVVRDGPCPTHAAHPGVLNSVPRSIVGLTDDQADNANPIWERCRRVGRAWEAARRVRPSLPDSREEVVGKQVVRHIEWEYQGDVLHILVPSFTNAEKAQLRTLTNSRFGEGRVQVA